MRRRAQAAQLVRTVPHRDGVDHDAATGYITHIFGELGRSLLQGTDSLATLTEKHMTPGGINMQPLTDLRRDGVPDMVRRALDRVLARLREQPSEGCTACT
ncbi:hypothetical protein DMH04_53245 [Kibdelosporangium aridum]|uniref:Pyrroline-5-carboxylate reductase dimerisation domain-containing protein n=1 Tax=Kibdelosporangium aridum TaxID=2030 RepID=A0A428Y361_KIBAR|nr:pyrroline-5-carboxylate reductase dimerization domain-containing protein [Kibdelosporangium aridum]RSM62001.1 hypothetical protein DMH04_53245 [Kibdelosporangium aridum]